MSQICVICEYLPYIATLNQYSQLLYFKAIMLTVFTVADVLL